MVLYDCSLKEGAMPKGEIVPVGEHRAQSECCYPSEERLATSVDLAHKRRGNAQGRDDRSGAGVYKP